ncbi:MAG: hypothetical protein AABY34_06345 [Pseudomonadota bacterium]
MLSNAEYKKLKAIYRRVYHELAHDLPLGAGAAADLQALEFLRVVLVERRQAVVAKKEFILDAIVRPIGFSSRAEAEWSLLNRYNDPDAMRVSMQGQKEVLDRSLDLMMQNSDMPALPARHVETREEIDQRERAFDSLLPCLEKFSDLVRYYNLKEGKLKQAAITLDKNIVILRQKLAEQIAAEEEVPEKGSAARMHP